MAVQAPIIFIRHGATPWNDENRYQGNTETELSDKGREQAANNAAKIADFFEREKTPSSDISLVASPLIRAQSSAAIIGETLEIGADRTFTSPPLREISMGRWEGMQNLEVKETYYLERKSRKPDRWNFKPEGGESLADRHQEVFKHLQTLSSNTIVITHAGIIRIVQHVLGGMPEQEAASFTMPHEGLLLWKSDKTHFIP